jgi:hypothetical protein
MNSRYFHLPTRPIRLIFVLMVSFLAISAPASEGPQLHYADRGFYIGGALTLSGLSAGDFGGRAIYQTDRVFVFTVPRSEPRNGGRVAFGIRLKALESKLDWGLEVYTQRGPHSYVPAYGLAYFDVTGLGGKVYFSTSRRIQPFLSAGVVRATAGIEEGFVGISSGPIEEAVSDRLALEGYGADFGGGVAFYISPHAAVVTGATFRCISFGSLKAFGTDYGDLLGKINATGWDVYLGMTFTIPMKAFN